MLSGHVQQLDELAKTHTQRLPVGSSAAGEQPKFILPASRGKPNRIVKFGPPRGTPFGERWNDLLLLEQLALHVLAEGGIAAAHCEVIRSAERTYLAPERFDAPLHLARRHVLPLSAIHEPFAQTRRLHWVDSMQTLHAKRLCSQTAVRQTALTYAFGRFIGNSDMHYGNLSVFVDDLRKPQFTLTPVYDMLPMVLRPNPISGGLDLEPVRGPSSPPGFEAEQHAAKQLALQFWSTAAQTADISQGMRKLALENTRGLRDGQ